MSLPTLSPPPLYAIKGFCEEGAAAVCAHAGGKYALLSSGLLGLGLPGKTLLLETKQGGDNGISRMRLCQFTHSILRDLPPPPTLSLCPPSCSLFSLFTKRTLPHSSPYELYYLLFLPFKGPCHEIEIYSEGL